jgi:hypothetical protein
VGISGISPIPWNLVQNVLPARSVAAMVMASPNAQTAMHIHIMKKRVLTSWRRPLTKT